MPMNRWHIYCKYSQTYRHLKIHPSVLSFQTAARNLYLRFSADSGMTAVEESGIPIRIMMRIRRFFLITTLISLILCLAHPAAATQAHGAPEGLFVHQLSHLFFIFAMAILIYWLRSRGLVREIGWRNIQYAALFFILWSLDAFFVHLLDEQFLLVQVTRTGPWQIKLDTPDGMAWLGGVYYLLKLDHLLCVPGLIFLFVGLRRLSPPESAAEKTQKGAL